MSDLLYTETQKFTQWWIRVPLWLLTIAMAWFLGTALYFQIFLGIPYGSKPAPDGVLISVSVVVFLLVGLLNWLFIRLKLVVEVRVDGLYYRFPPIIGRFKKIAGADIASYTIRSYRPVAEYGGWGIRWGGSKRGDAFNVRGSVGLQLELKKGKKILFGTQRPDALKAAMDKMMKSPLKQ